MWCGRRSRHTRSASGRHGPPPISRSRSRSRQDRASASGGAQAQHEAVVEETAEETSITEALGRAGTPSSISDNTPQSRPGVEDRVIQDQRTSEGSRGDEPLRTIMQDLLEARRSSRTTPASGGAGLRERTRSLEAIVESLASQLVPFFDGSERPGPAPPDALLAIRTVEFDDSAVIDMRQAPRCSICICEFQAGDALEQLPGCGHLFHGDCIREWLRRYAVCPNCRCGLLGPGATVRVVGLVASANLNGSTGTCRERQENGRWQVRLTSGERKAFRQENLEVVAPIPGGSNSIAQAIAPLVQDLGSMRELMQGMMALGNSATMQQFMNDSLNMIQRNPDTMQQLVASLSMMQRTISAMPVDPAVTSSWQQAMSDPSLMQQHMMEFIEQMRRTLNDQVHTGNSSNAV